MSDEKDFVEILDEQLEEQIENVEFDSDSMELDESEVAMAKELNVKIDEPEPKKEDEQEEVVAEVKKEEVEEPKKDEVKEPELAEDLDGTFENMSLDPQAEHDQLTKFDKKDKAFYWKWKKDKQKRQDAEQAHKFLQEQLAKRDAELAALRKAPKDIDGLLDAEEENVKKNEPLTRAEFEADKIAQDQKAAEANARSARLNRLEAEARNKYEDFDSISNVAVTEMRKNPQEYRRFMAEVNHPEGEPGEFLYQLGKRNAKPAEVVKQEVVVEEKQPKKQTSAALNTAPARKSRRVSYEDLTVEDLTQMSMEQFRSIPKKVRESIMHRS